MAKSKAERKLEYYKQRYLDALKDFVTEEELRLASLEEPKVNLHNIRYYSAYYNGARKAFSVLGDSRLEYREKAYKDAVIKLITSDIRYAEIFLTGAHDLCFRNHKRDKKGKLISCEAYFAEKVTIYKEV